jgi:membrane-associated phospholipid phosphatase
MSGLSLGSFRASVPQKGGGAVGAAPPCPQHTLLLSLLNRLARVASGDETKIREGRTSYPSGHAAETTMTFGLLTFYLLAKLRLFTRQSPVGGPEWLLEGLAGGALPAVLRPWWWPCRCW